jgi:nucleotide-binding universal stress UspA family protein
MFGHVLVLMDPPHLPRTTIITAAAIATEQCAELTLLHVQERRRGLLTPAESPEYDETQIERFLGNGAAIAAEYGAFAETRTARGGPVHKAIVRFAKTFGVDVILMSSTRDRGAAAREHGELMQALLSEVNVPVLVIYEALRSSSRRVSLRRDRSP